MGSLAEHPPAPAPAGTASTTAATRTATILPLNVVDRTGQQPGRQKREFRLKSILRRVWVMPLILVILTIGGVVGLYFQPPGLQKVMALLHLEPGAGSSHPIAVPAEKLAALPESLATDAFRAGNVVAPVVSGSVVGLGRLVPLGDIRVIAPPFGAGDARIAALPVEEGDRVAAGDIIAVMDNEKSLRAAVASARANVAGKEAALRQAREMVISSRDEARASLSRAEAAVANAKVELARAEQLAPSGTISKSTLDSKRVAYEQALQDAAKAKATLARYSSVVLDEQADVFVALSGIEYAKAELEKALAELDKAYVRAPIAGTVLTVHVRPGEKPGTNGIVNLGNIDEMTAEIELYQTLIGRVSVGAPVTITADALPGPLEGTVTRLGLEVARQTSTDATPAANTDARIVKVYVQLSPASIAVAQRYTNLQVTARIAARKP